MAPTSLLLLSDPPPHGRGALSHGERRRRDLSIGSPPAFLRCEYLTEAEPARTGGARGEAGFLEGRGA